MATRTFFRESSTESLGSQDSKSLSASPSPIKTKTPRPSRTRKEPAKLRDNLESKEAALLDLSRKTVVKCCQTNKLYRTEVSKLTTVDNRQLLLDDLTRGSTLLMNYQGKDFPVVFMNFADEKARTKASKKSSKRNCENDGEVPFSKKSRGDDGGLPIVRDRTNVLSTLEAANESTAKASVHVKDHTCSCDKVQLLITRLESCIKMMETVFESHKVDPSDKPTTVKEDPENLINGRNINLIPARDAYAFGLALMDALFTKEELASSLLYKSKKSTKPGLDEAKVQRLISLVQRRYPEGWDIKSFIAKANQKCRDSGKVVVIS